MSELCVQLSAASLCQAGHALCSSACATYSICNTVDKCEQLTLTLALTAGATKDTIAQNDKGPGAWSDSVGDAFLAPYDLNADKSTFTANGTKGPIHQELNNLDVKVYAYQGDKDSKTLGNISRCACTAGPGRQGCWQTLDGLDSTTSKSLLQSIDC